MIPCSECCLQPPFHECGCLHGHAIAPYVYVIEDDEILQRATARMVKRAMPDVHVMTFASALGVIAQLSTADLPLAIVSDYDVLGGTGADVLNWVRAHAPQLAKRFVFHSGNDAARELGVPLIEKGTGVAEFVRQLRQHLHTSAELAPRKEGQ